MVYLGFGTFDPSAPRDPKTGLEGSKLDPITFLLLALTIASQIGGAYVIQWMLYPLATGRDNDYPGIAGAARDTRLGSSHCRVRLCST